MPRTKLSEIQAYLFSNFKAEFSQKSKGLILYDGLAEHLPSWPRVAHDVSAATIKAESPEQSQRDIIKRLKSFLYPYPEGNKAKKTFFEHLESLGFLQVLLTPPLLWDIRMVWQFQRYYKLELELKQSKISEHKLPLEFHRHMLFLVFDHMKHIKQLADRYQITDKAWLLDYFAAIRKQLLKEGASYYPQARRWFRPAHKIPVLSLSVLNQVDMYFALVSAFKTLDTKNNKLAYQLTALICSSADSIRSGKLDPDPEKVRKYVKDYRRKTKNG